MGDATSGTFDELIGDRSEHVQLLTSALRDLILDIDPLATEVVRLGDNAVTFGIGSKKMSEGYVYLMPLQDRVNLGFYHAADLPDPEGLLDGTGKTMRHVKVTILSKDLAGSLIALVTAAIAERKAATS